MKNILFIMLLVYSNSAKTQNFDETISYINTLLKASTFNLKIEGVNNPYENVYDSVCVDKNGKLECYRFLLDSKTKQVEKKMRFFVYLKSIIPGDKKDYTINYIFKLKCIRGDYCFGGLSVERDDIFFDINTSSNRDKLFNAFTNLITLAKANKDFYEKDPFGN